MVDLTLKERATLAKLEHKSAYVQRQADDFTLFFDSKVICQLDSKICKILIEKRALVEIGNNHEQAAELPGTDYLGDVSTEPIVMKGDERWIYVADPCLFAPNFVIGAADELPF